MPLVAGQGSDFHWVVTPIRETFPRKRAQHTLREYCDKNKLSKVNIDAGKEIYAAFVPYKDLCQDFARSLGAHIKVRNYLYIESKKDEYIFIRIQNKIIKEDRIIRNDADLKEALETLCSAQEHRSMPAFEIEMFGVSVSVELQTVLDNLKTTKITAIHRPYTESLEYDEQFTFRSVEEGLRTLTDKGLQVYVVSTIVAMVAAWFLVAEYTPKPLIETVVRKSPYKEYVGKMLNLPAASTRLSQDFFLQLKLREELVGWHLFAVEHVKQGVFYAVRPDRLMRPTLESLRQYALANNLQLVNKEGLTLLFAQGRRDTPYQKEQDVRTFTLEQLVGNINDNTNRITPFVSVITGARDTKEHWMEQTITFELKNADRHDLMRIAAVVDGYMTSGGTVNYPTTMLSAEYDIDAVGKLNGNIQIRVYGDEHYGA